jgi:hypothetical protein
MREKKKLAITHLFNNQPLSPAINVPKPKIIERPNHKVPLDTLGCGVLKLLSYKPLKYARAVRGVLIKIENTFKGVSEISDLRRENIII